MTAKDTEIKDIALINQFADWLEGEVTPRVISDYKSRLKKINREFISTLTTGSNKTPFDLLGEYVLTTAKAGPKYKTIEGLLTAIASNINKRCEDLKNSGNKNLASFRSESSAYRRYMQFVLEQIAMGHHSKSHPTITQEAVIAILNGEEINLDKDDIIANFTSRINTQDRNTGDKTFFPLSLITKILERGLVREWAKKEASKVMIHLQDRSVTVSEITGMKISPKSREAYAVIGNESHRIYNPELDGKKEPMEILQLKDIDLDHQPDIHDILKELRGSLPALDTLTEWIKKEQKEGLGYKTIDSKNYDKICTSLFSNKDFLAILTPDFKETLLKEIYKVSEKHKLQVASSGWNRSEKKQAKKKQTKL